MTRQYSLKSARLIDLPACIDGLRKLIRHDRLEVRTGFSHELAPNQSDALKEVSETEFPIRVVFIRSGGSSCVELSAHWGILGVDLEGFDAQKASELFGILEMDLHLVAPTEEERRSVASFPSMMAVIWEVHDKVDEISVKLDAGNPQGQDRKRCFVSFRFDDHNKALAFELKEFLELVDVDFVSGLGYEPRSLSEKVLERLTAPLDLFIVILSASGDSAWLNQEMGVARGRELPVLVLKEEDSDADLGMLGDTEYLSFPRNNISRTFVGLLQALSYVERSKTRAKRVGV